MRIISQFRNLFQVEFSLISDYFCQSDWILESGKVRDRTIYGVMDYVSYKDKKALSQVMKSVYQALTEKNVPGADPS